MQGNEGNRRDKYIYISQLYDTCMINIPQNYILIYSIILHTCMYSTWVAR